MFRHELSERLSKIFGFSKTTFNAPSINSTTGSFEQDTLFIEINDAHSRVNAGKEYSRVSGALVVFSQMEKLPFGYFTKRIQHADPALTKQFFFFDIDLNPMNSPARIQNITERRVRFLYLYSAQYDPSHGLLNSIALTLGENL